MRGFDSRHLHRYTLCMKKTLIALGMLIVLGLVFGFWASKSPAPAGQEAQEQHILKGEQVGEGNIYRYAASEQYYEVNVEYPDTGNAQAQAALETGLKTEIDDFVQNVQGLDASVLPSLAGGHKLMLDIGYKSYSGTNNTGSYLFTIYADTGGAHPNTYFKTFVFDQTGKQLSIEDVLKNNPNGLEELSLVVSNDVVAQMKDRIGVDDVTSSIFAEGLSPKAENFSNFVVDGADLVIEIPPYQVAAYAVGSFEVRMPLNSINQ